MDDNKEKLIKQLNMVVCICKGIPLSKVLPAIQNSSNIDQVNEKTGCGSGGCKGQRCGPRIRALLKKAQKDNQNEK